MESPLWVLSHEHPCARVSIIFSDIYHHFVLVKQATTNIRDNMWMSSHLVFVSVSSGTEAVNCDRPPLYYTPHLTHRVGAKIGLDEQAEIQPASVSDLGWEKLTINVYLCTTYPHPSITWPIEPGMQIGLDEQAKIQAASVSDMWLSGLMIILHLCTTYPLPPSPHP